MNRWQVLTLAGLFVLVVCVLLGALNLAMPLIGGPTPTATATFVATPRPTRTLTATPTSIPTTPAATPTLVLQQPTATPLLTEADDTTLARILEATLADLGYPSQCMFYDRQDRRMLSVLTSMARPDPDSLGFLIAAIAEFSHGLLASGDALSTVVLVVEDNSGAEEHLGVTFAAADASAFFAGDLSADDFLARWQTVTDADLP